MIQIMKASAGSGKTYNLANTYIRLLLGSGDPYAYRHILAVTFTNKATDEMKSRILKILHEKAAEDPEARKMLVNILHDYSAFSVSTIDKFFQQTLKAFSREIGQFSSYQVELDRKSLIHEAVDRILDSLDEQDPAFVGWIQDIAKACLQTGNKFNVDKEMYSAAERLKNGEFYSQSEKYGIDPARDFSKEKLEEVRKKCEVVIRAFLDRLRELDPEYYASVKPGMMVKMPGKNYLKAASPELKAHFGDPFKLYRTAFLIKNNSATLGMSRELEESFSELLREKNVLSLDDSNTILKGIIDGSDAPFIYEKLGVRYEHFLLDEFQDTSTIQWENFLPLLQESDSNGRENLIVGDVKQSIYRWRHSDWNLLASQVGRQFPDAQTNTLDSNWRSAESIVRFNNDFYRFAAGVLDAQMDGSAPGMPMSDIYADVEQKIKTKDTQKGRVRVSFVEPDEMLGAIEASVRIALSSGARPGDIAILIRSHNNGNEIANYLVSRDIRVISDDSLEAKSSVIVRRLISLLSCIDKPKDTVSTYLAESLGIEFPSVYHSLVDLSLSLLRRLREMDPEVYDSEILYIQSFLDAMQDWTSVNGNNLMLFLKYADETDMKISSPDDAGAVRIMTIHKSKGLEFPYVIFPYADGVTLFKSDEHWSRPDLGGTALNVDGIYPVELSSESKNTYFDREYAREAKLQVVDNMNVFYVATTRASCCLDIISKMPAKTTFLAPFIKGKDVEYKSMSQILYAFCAKRGSQFGEAYDFSRMERKDGDPAEDFKADFDSIDLAGRLHPSDDASDFFSDSGEAGVSASARLRGIAMHDILSLVKVPSDLEGAVAEVVRRGVLTVEEGMSTLDYLKEKIDEHPDWFPLEGEVFNEVTVIGGDGGLHRPDRVLVEGDRVTVIDYKFGGKKNSYVRQVRGYLNLYRSLGYTDVRGFLWYVPENEITEIDGFDNSLNLF